MIIKMCLYFIYLFIYLVFIANVVHLRISSSNLFPNHFRAEFPFHAHNHTYQFSNKSCSSDTPVSVASSSTQSTLAKPIVTTAPSSVQQQQQYTQPISQNTIPQLKQKTGIIKSKVPPPVPPRGSPRVDRRTSAGSHKSMGLSPRATPTSTGEPNFLNDKYFDVIQQNVSLNLLTPQRVCQRRSSTPIIFGERRSPTCVSDWLEVNDFAASDFDEAALELDINETRIKIKKRKPLTIQTAILQRQTSFRSLQSSGSSVRSMVDSYLKKQNLSQKPKVPPRKTRNKANAKTNISRLRKTFEHDKQSNDHDVASNAHDRSSNDFNNASNPIIRIDRVDSIFDTLKRKRQIRPRNELDENGNEMAKKCEILQSHSNLEMIDDSKCLDFSIDGEFV